MSDLRERHDLWKKFYSPRKNQSPFWEELAWDVTVVVEFETFLFGTALFEVV